MSASRALQRVVNIEDLRQLARRRAPLPIFDYVDGGAEGEVTLNGQKLTGGDAVAVSEETGLELAASKPSQVLLFDLN